MITTLRWLPDERREGAFINEKDYNHLIYNSNADTEVVVTKKNNWFYFFTSYFSFLSLYFSASPFWFSSSMHWACMLILKQWED
jgi:hypothetical protein